MSILLGTTNLRGNSEQAVKAYNNGTTIDAGLFVQKIDGADKYAVVSNANTPIKVDGISTVKNELFTGLSELKNDNQVFYLESKDIGVQFQETSGGTIGQSVWLSSTALGKATIVTQAGKTPIGILLSTIDLASDGFSEKDSNGDIMYGARIAFRSVREGTPVTSAPANPINNQTAKNK